MSEKNIEVSNPCRKNPIVLSIAANDSSGLAGIATDIKTQAGFSVHSSVVITANTAQNNQKVFAINPVSVDSLKAQLKAVSEFNIAIVKVGLIANLDQAKVVAKFIRKKNLPMLLDPVLGSTSQYEFIDPKSILEYVEALLPLCTLITPNREEASILTNQPINECFCIETAAKKLRALGAKNVLIKGGIAPTNNQHSTPNLSREEQLFCNDYFLSSARHFWLTSETVRTSNTRGTGCAFASSISSAMALGYNIEDSVVIGKMAINQGLKSSYCVSGEKGPVAISHFPNRQTNLPILSKFRPATLAKYRFLDCTLPVSDKTVPLGLYPIVDRAEWVERLAKVNVTTIQLRVKDLPPIELEQEIIKANQFAQHYGIRLFINDHWQLAIKHSVYGVHLGQEDLDSADMQAIQQAGLRLGISTHCHYEVARAHYYRPSYIACGPIYHTDSKQMPWIPQGYDGLNYWLDMLDYPVVAIGGINQQHFRELGKTKVDGIAMISAITLAKDPEQVCKDFIQQFESSKGDLITSLNDLVIIRR